MYALIEYAGKQFRVEEGLELRVPLISEKVGSKVILDKILYFDDDKKKVVGTPFVINMNIDAKITEHSRDKKVIVFKFKRRKGYQRKNGHRQKFSVIKIGKLEKAAKKTTKAATPKTAATKKVSSKKPTSKKVTKKKD